MGGCESGEYGGGGGGSGEGRKCSDKPVSLKIKIALSGRKRFFRFVQDTSDWPPFTFVAPSPRIRAGQAVDAHAARAPAPPDGDPHRARAPASASSHRPPRTAAWTARAPSTKARGGAEARRRSPMCAARAVQEGRESAEEDPWG